MHFASEHFGANSVTVSTGLRTMRTHLVHFASEHFGANLGCDRTRTTSVQIVNREFWCKLGCGCTDCPSVVFRGVLLFSGRD